MELSRVEREIKKEFPSFRVVMKKDSRLMSVLDVLLRIISFGQLRYFMKFTTTLGTTVYVPNDWERFEALTRAVILRHEAVHMRQSRRYGRLLFSFLYLFFPLPVVLAYYRTELEKEAYEESLRAYHEYGVDIRLIKAQMVSHFTSAEYLWMWPLKKSVEAWFDTTVERITKRSA